MGACGKSQVVSALEKPLLAGLVPVAGSEVVVSASCGRSGVACPVGGERVVFQVFETAW